MVGNIESAEPFPPLGEGHVVGEVWLGEYHR